jgi:hypothetical protein
MNRVELFKRRYSEFRLAAVRTFFSVGMDFVLGGIFSSHTNLAAISALYLIGNHIEPVKRVLFE